MYCAEDCIWTLCVVLCSTEYKNLNYYFDVLPLGCYMKNTHKTQLFIIDTQSQLYMFLLKSSLLQTVHNYRYIEKHI